MPLATSQPPAVKFVSVPDFANGSARFDAKLCQNRGALVEDGVVQVDLLRDLDSLGNLS